MVASARTIRGSWIYLGFLSLPLLAGWHPSATADTVTLVDGTKVSGLQTELFDGSRKRFVMLEEGNTALLPTSDISYLEFTPGRDTVTLMDDSVYLDIQTIGYNGQTNLFLVRRNDREVEIKASEVKRINFQPLREASPPVGRPSETGATLETPVRAEGVAAMKVVRADDLPQSGPARAEVDAPYGIAVLRPYEPGDSNPPPPAGTFQATQAPKSSGVDAAVPRPVPEGPIRLEPSKAKPSVPASKPKPQPPAEKKIEPKSKTEVSQPTAPEPPAAPAAPPKKPAQPEPAQPAPPQEAPTPQVAQAPAAPPAQSSQPAAPPSQPAAPQPSGQPQQAPVKEEPKPAAPAPPTEPASPSPSAPAQAAPPTMAPPEPPAQSQPPAPQQPQPAGNPPAPAPAPAPQQPAPPSAQQAAEPAQPAAQPAQPAPPAEPTPIQIPAPAPEAKAADLPQPATDPQALLVNPSFEEWEAQTPVGWEVFGGGKAVRTTDAKEGNLAVEFLVPEEKKVSGISQTLHLDPSFAGHHLEVTAQSKAKNRMGLAFFVEVRSKDGKVIPLSQSDPGIGEWVTLTHEFEVPPNPQLIILRIQLTQAAKESAFLDNVQIKLVK